MSVEAGPTNFVDRLAEGIARGPLRREEESRLAHEARLRYKQEDLARRAEEAAFRQHLKEVTPRLTWTEVKDWTRRTVQKVRTTFVKPKSK